MPNSENDANNENLTPVEKIAVGLEQRKQRKSLPPGLDRTVQQDKNFTVTVNLNLHRCPSCGRFFADEFPDSTCLCAQCYGQNEFGILEDSLRANRQLIELQKEVRSLKRKLPKAKKKK